MRPCRRSAGAGQRNPLAHQCAGCPLPSRRAAYAEAHDRLASSGARFAHRGRGRSARLRHRRDKRRSWQPGSKGARPSRRRAISRWPAPFCTPAPRRSRAGRAAAIRRSSRPTAAREDLNARVREAAADAGASRWQRARSASITATSSASLAHGSSNRGMAWEVVVDEMSSPRSCWRHRRRRRLNELRIYRSRVKRRARCVRSITMGVGLLGVESTSILPRSQLALERDLNRRTSCRPRLHDRTARRERSRPVKVKRRDHWQCRQRRTLHVDRWHAHGPELPIDDSERIGRAAGGAAQEPMDRPPIYAAVRASRDLARAIAAWSARPPKGRTTRPRPRSTYPSRSSSTEGGGVGWAPLERQRPAKCGAASGWTPTRRGCMPRRRRPKTSARLHPDERIPRIVRDGRAREPHRPEDGDPA